ncbi:MAG: hypothetical protein ABR567_16210 [Myxococcales bacterium]
MSPPPVGQPTASVVADGSSSDWWSAGGTDDSGTVALIRTNDNQLPPFALHVLDPWGVERARYQSVDASFAEHVFEQRDGFEVIGFDAWARGVYMAAIDRRGTVVATATIPGEYAGPTAGDPLGGIRTVLKRIGDDSVIAFAAYDEPLKLRFRTQLVATGRPVALAVDRQGNSLLLLEGAGPIDGIWIDHSGKAGAEFKAVEEVPATTSIVLAPRIGSGLFAGRSPGSWTHQFDALGAGSPPPDWLVARPGSTLHLARGGHAYAVVHPLPSGSACGARIEVVTSSGASCGTAVFPTESPWCHPALAVGRDGTVVEGAVFDGPSAGHRTSVFRWWAGFLK